MKASVSFSLEIGLIQTINDRAEKGRRDKSEVVTELLLASLEAERRANQASPDRPPLTEG